MKYNFYIFIFLPFIALLQVTPEQENKVKNSSEENQIRNVSEAMDLKPGEKKKPRIKFIDLAYKDPDRKSQTIELNNNNFDSYVKNGNENRWLLIFYAESSSYCRGTKSLIDKIIEEKKYKNINNIKFGSVDIDRNLKLQMRFNITGIPVVLLVENNKMLELSNIPIEENLIKSIEIETLVNDKFTLKDFPQDINIIELFRRLLSFTLKYLSTIINSYLKDYKINYELGDNIIFMLLVFSCSAVSSLILILLRKCFCKEKIIKKDVKEENKDKDSIVKNEEKKEGTNDNINKNEDNNKSEELKKMTEDKKEEEMKEKRNEEKINNINNNGNKNEEKKKEKKKKKE